MATASFDQLPRELQIMPFNLRILELVGLWGTHRQPARFVTICTLELLVVLLPKAVLGIGSTELAAIVKGIAEFIFESSVYFPMVIFAFKKSSFKKLVEELIEIIWKVTSGENSKDCYDVIVKHHQEMEKLLKVFLIYCGVGPLIYTIPSVATSYGRYFSAKFGNNSEFPIFELPMEQEFYGLQIRSNFAHYHIFVGFSTLASFVCGFMALIKITTTLFMMRYSTLAFRLVVERLKYLSKSAKVNTVEVENLVNLHEQAFRITELVEQICNVTMGLQFLACILFWCLTMFYASTTIDSNLFNLVIIYWLSLMETFGYSFLGSELSEQAETVGEAIYDLPWYDHPVELQRYYRLMIQRTQRPTGITGVNFFLVQLTTFASVMQTSYSYFVVLKDAFEEL